MTHSILISPADAKSGLARALEELGARVIVWPKLDIDHLEDCLELDEAIENLFGYDWLILKNQTAAEYFLRRFERSHDAGELDELKILTIGERTHQALCEKQFHVDLVAGRSTEVHAAVQSYVGNLNGLNLIIPAANPGRDAIGQQMEESGARVDTVLSYRTCANPDELVKLSALIAGGGIDFVAFAEPAGVEEFASLFDTDDLSRLLAGVGVGCLDESTRKAARGYGVVDFLVPAEPSFNALARLILE
jgi:uroporphyrinogen-III synthase